MGIIKNIQYKCKLFCGLIFSVDYDVFQLALYKLKANFGPLDFQSKMVEFNFTKYYNVELGDNLFRCWVSFEKLIYASSISKIKHITNGIEKELSVQKRRTINIDPGYITLASVILVTTKNYSHRLYLSDGIYGEVSMLYKNKSFNPLEWTYKDYRTSIAMNFFSIIRNKLLKKI
ncbi:MAG: DUF4416 family protein [Endomicrobium sp.]|jgi:hypothetical protein|nr:DUF4416 family protein [Endomicrobium sp.]